MMESVMNTCKRQRACDRMRTGWRTEAAVDSKHTGHWRLGLAIVLLRSRHGAYYVSNYHQRPYLTTTVCVCACTHLHVNSPTPPKSVYPEETHQLPSSSFLSQPSAHSSSGTYCTAAVCLCAAATWNDWENHSLQRHKKTFVPCRTLEILSECRNLQRVIRRC